MKVTTILGTRPEIIRLSLILPLLDQLLGPDHKVFHTGQSYDPELDANFWTELGLRSPDFNARAGGGSFAHQMAALLPALEGWLQEHRPDRFLVLGDTNSSLGALVAARLGIPVYHLEAGNRSCGAESPEEINRRVIDHVSTVHLCYTERARANLLAEGVPLARTYVVGNPMAEVLHERGLLEAPDQSQVEDLTSRYGLLPGPFALLSLHRAENVDDKSRLRRYLDAVGEVATEKGWDILMTLHPRTAARLHGLGRCGETDRIRMLKPLPFSDWARLQKMAALVLSDSGTAPEEAALLGVPLVILRGYMERQELLEAGWGVLWDPDRSPCTLSQAVAAATVQSSSPARLPQSHAPRPVAATTIRLLLSPVPPA